MRCPVCGKCYLSVQYDRIGADSMLGQKDQCVATFEHADNEKCWQPITKQQEREMRRHRR